CRNGEVRTRQNDQSHANLLRRSSVSNPLGGSSDGFISTHPNGRREYMAWNVGQWQRFAGYAHAVIIVVAALMALVFQNRNVNGDFYVRMIPAHPFDGRFKVGVAG